MRVYKWINNSAKHYNTSSVFVFPSDYLFCNFSLLEAMERGIPSIVADVENADRIIDRINGFLTKQDSDILAKYIIKLLSDEQLRIKMGKAAREKIVKEFKDKDTMLHI